MEETKERAKRDKDNKSNGGTKRKRNKDSDSKDEDKNKSNKRKKCPHCHKTHAGECCLKGTKHDKTKTNNSTSEQIKAAVQEGLTASLNQMKVSNQPTWSKGMDKAEMECIAVMYKQENNLEWSDKVEHIPSDELKELRANYAASRNASK